MRVRRTMVPLVLAASVAACGDDPSGPGGVEAITELPRALTAAETEVIAGSNAFAFGLLREARAERGEASTFVSPLSVSMALGMTMNGAAGESWTQMRDALGFQGMEEPAINRAYRDLIDLLTGLDPSVEMALANSVWSDASRVALLPDFIQRVETWFGAQAATLDFSDPDSKDVINGWVENATNGRIEDLLDVIPASAVAYLVNAVYFLGDWRTAFEPGNTRSGPFTRADGSTVTVRYMSDNVGYRGLNVGTPDAPQGVELPYGGGAFTAVAVLPPAGQGIDELVAGLDVATWETWMAAFDAAADGENLDDAGSLVELPRFELDWKADLKEPLRAMGMEAPFLGGVADFSRMNGERDLFISRVIHQTFVKVDEAGTEAAAATAVEMRETTAPADPPRITFDRPFLFAIRERYSGTILFLGVVGDPA
ncbi:MAG: serpin family protein [Gemmatimonadota bacterium]